MTVHTQVHTLVVTTQASIFLSKLRQAGGRRRALEARRAGDCTPGALPSNPSSPCGRTELLGIGRTGTTEEGSCPSPPGFPQSSSSRLHLFPPLSCHAETLAWFFSLHALSMAFPNAANLQTCLQQKSLTWMLTCVAATSASLQKSPGPQQPTVHRSH